MKYAFIIVRPHTRTYLPISPAFDNPKCSQLFVQVIADNDSESQILVFFKKLSKLAKQNLMYVVDR